MTIRALALALIAVAAATHGAAGEERAAPTNASLCELTEHPEKFDGRLVRTSAILVGGEGMKLYDPRCTWLKGNVAGEEVAGVEARSDRRAFRRAGRLLARHGRVRVTVLARFHGPRELEIPETATPQLRSMLQGRERWYGHLDCCRTMLEIVAVESAEKVAPRTPNLAWGTEPPRSP